MAFHWRGCGESNRACSFRVVKHESCSRATGGSIHCKRCTYRRDLPHKSLQRWNRAATELSLRCREELDSLVRVPCALFFLREPVGWPGASAPSDPSKHSRLRLL